MTALELLWCAAFWLLVIWWLVARYRPNSSMLVDLLIQRCPAAARRQTIAG
jgi:hypothetical protein